MKNEMNRKTYEKVKRMNHVEMQRFIQEERQSAFEAGQKSMESRPREISRDKMMAAISEIRGIGAAKSSLIVDKIIEHLGAESTEGKE